MIKEIFEIEPVQKNTLIIFIAIFSLSFLQLYLFKPEILEKNSLVIIGICFALSVCWSILNMPSLFFYHGFKTEGDNPNFKIINLNHIVFSFGLLAISWIILLTYIAYELNFNFKDLIRLAILLAIIKTIFWVIMGYRKSLKTKVK